MATDLNRDFTKDVQMTKKHMKRHSTSLIITEKIIIKTTMRYCNTPIRIVEIKKTDHTTC